MKKTIDVEPALWEYLKARAKRNGRTLYGELNYILEGLKKRDRANEVV